MSNRIQNASLAALLGIAVHFACGYWLGYPFLTDVLAEWIMARTPSHWALPLMDSMGDWAKPFAATGGLAFLGSGLLAAHSIGRYAPLLALPIVAYTLGYDSLLGLATFFLPAILFLARPEKLQPISGRRKLITSLAMTTGTAAVALEAYLRNQALAARSIEARPLFPMRIPEEHIRWGDGLVRKPVTPIREFYVMSKNTVDPAPDPANYRLQIQIDGRPLRSFSYTQLLNLPRQERYVSLRCVSNSLKSNLMGTGYWSGLTLEQLVRREEVPNNIVEMAVIGLDGHGDSYQLPYAFSGEPLLALGLNGDTLTRNHGFPIRMLSPKYYGFKSIKWIDRINFVSTPYFGTWPQLGYTKEPVIHPGAYIDKVKSSGTRIDCGGIAYSGHGQVAQVQLRLLDADKQPLIEWQAATLEAPLSEQTFTRWIHSLPSQSAAQHLEARVQDTSGRWQSTTEQPLFPNGVSGPTIKSL
jgi:DMSO/TMAO reductase YedYZ molybdopterin-dependent catalytic subunit